MEDIDDHCFDHSCIIGFMHVHKVNGRLAMFDGKFLHCRYLTWFEALLYRLFHVLPPQ